jgi:rfaE bifunctional protein kinase chain/domain
VTELRDVLARFPGKHVLVVGDVMLDEYVWGTVRRISQEAPVPVVELHKRSYLPGGAANAAANIASLRGVADLVGVVGADQAGGQLRAGLEDRGIGSVGLLAEEGRPTTTKTRIIAHNQQVVRVDHEQRRSITPEIERRLLELVDERLPAMDACILSDYAKGTVSPALARHVLARAAALGKPVVVDPKGSDFGKYRGATLLKPNLQEAGQFLGRDLDLQQHVLEAGRGLLQALDCNGVLITRGADGMSLFQRSKEPVHIAAHAREVYDVTGAGDTVIAALTMALAVGANLEEAARLASHAAAIIVGRVGTAAIGYEELWSILERSEE